MIRPLEIDDYNKGFMELINYFTRFPEIKTLDDFTRHFTQIKQSSEIFVLEDEKSKSIISAGTLHIEYKFHNNFKSIAHLQDIVVKEEYRGRGHGKDMIMFLIEKAKTKNCYKIVLNSSQHNKMFYEKLGFIEKGVELNLYLN